MDPNVNNSEDNDITDVSQNVGVSVSTAQAITSNQPVVMITTTTEDIPNISSNEDSVFENTEDNHDHEDTGSSSIENITKTRVSQRELKNLTSHNVPGEDEIIYHESTRRSRVTLDELRRNFNYEVEKIKKALGKFPNKRPDNLQVGAVPGIKGAFASLKSAQVGISDSGMEL